MRVRNFMFCDGVAAKLPNYAKFTAEFIKWSNEPGIAVCKISTGKILKIPAFSLEDFKPENYPIQEEHSAV